MFCANRLINRINLPFITRIRYFHHEFTNPDPKKKDSKSEIQIPGAIQSKYKVFQDEDSPEIFDVEEEKQRQFQESDEPSFERTEFKNLSLKRGVNGVFDIEDLVDVLRKENAVNIFVCSVPKELKYVDYMCVVTGKSYRHMLAIAQFVRRVYKIKRQRGDILPKIEGEKCRDWIALDLGNIALHIFAEKTRVIYDLESLWSIGPEYDKEFNKPNDTIIELFEKHSVYLHDLKPNNIKEL